MAPASNPLPAFLREAVASGVFPGAVAAIGQGSFARAASYISCAGRLARDGADVTAETIWDLASLTKPVVAALALRLVQSGVVDLHVPVSVWLPELSGTPGGEATLALLLSHRAGLSAWGSLYQEAKGAPGSAETRAFMLREAATRTGPEPPAGHSVYSDLGYLIAGETLARAGGAPLDALVAREVTRPLGLSADLFYAASLSEPEREALRPRVAPTEYCAFRGRLLRFEVHDENCYAFGGISGHAGSFGTARGVLRFGLAVLDALAGRSVWLDQALVRWALRPRKGGGHVVGWDTKSAEGSSAGARLSSRSFGHLGFTGTSLWCDPTRERCIVLLSNRVHPTRENITIRALRPQFHDLTADLPLSGE